ncbi:MAG: hypothetical protein ABIB93_02985 [Chloroflexota bacterium]
MILIDHILGYEGGEFIELETDGIIKSGFLLGLAMLIPVFFTWLGAILISKSKG